MLTSFNRIMVISWNCSVSGLKADKFVFEKKKMLAKKEGTVSTNYMYMNFWSQLR